MPNTPALIGQGIAGLFARAAVDAAGRAEREQQLAVGGLGFLDQRQLGRGQPHAPAQTRAAQEGAAG